jgi:TRAP-type transport system small permease protein
MAAGDKKSPETAGRGRKSPFLGPVRSISTTLDWSGRLIVAACLTFMFVALLLNVILRYVFGSGIAWAYEIHAILLPWLVAGGLVIATARGRNIAITLLSDTLKGRALLGLNLVISIAVLVISVSVVWTSQPILKASQFQTLSSLGIKQIWGYSSLAYAFGAMAVIAALDILRTLAGEDIAEHNPEHASLS